MFMGAVIIMKKKEYIFTEKEMENFAGFYNALKQIHIRLIKEWYEIKDRKIISPKIAK